MAARKKVLLKVIILGDSGYAHAHTHAQAHHAHAVTHETTMLWAGTSNASRGCMADQI
jgi:hypothetical protein